MDDEPFVSTPNVILVLTDDQGYGDLGCHGNDKIKTPNLDNLYKESIRFTQFYTSPLCSPTRAGLLTGRYEYRSGIRATVEGRSLLRPDEYTIAEIFSAAGYRTASWRQLPPKSHGSRFSGNAGSWRRRDRSNPRLLGQHLFQSGSMPQWYMEKIRRLLHRHIL